jgi:hypothetical protein
VNEVNEVVRPRADALQRLLISATDWLVDCAQITNENDHFDNPAGYRHTSFVGSFRTEYDTKSRRWWINGPAFHTGQAIRSLLVAFRRTGRDRYQQAAVLGGEFLLREVIDESHHPQNGLLLSLEQNDDEINVQVTFEALSGLLDLFAVSQDDRFLQAVVRSVDILIRDAYLPEHHLMLDHYSLKRREFFHDPDNTLPGRAMIDDALLLRLSAATGDPQYRQLFLEMARRLVRAEEPIGTWIGLPPWTPDRGRIHNRKNWWWGWPMIAAFNTSGEQSFLDMAIRAGNWWLNGQNLDGGLYYSPDPANRHNSFGVCTSVVAVSVLLWHDLWRQTADSRYLKAIDRAIGFLQAAQFNSDPDDENIRGALFESPKAPDGTTCPGFLIRDLAAIFAIRAADLVMDIDILTASSTDWIDTSMQW